MTLAPATWIATALAALALGWLLGPALQDRLDEIPVASRVRGRPLRIVAALAAGLAFAGFGDAQSAPLLWLVASLCWLPGLLWPVRHAEPPPERERLIEAIDRLLPQTQCGQC